MNFEVMGLIMRKAFGSPTKKQVVQMMASHINEVAEPYAWPSAERLAARCELSDRTVRRVWGELTESGLITEFGEKRFKGGAVKVWKINLKAILALPDAIASLESTLENEEEPYDNLSGGGEQPHDTVSKTPGHSVQNPLTLCQGNNPLEISKEESTKPAQVRDPVQEAVDTIWKSAPLSSRGRSGKKPLCVQLRAILKARKDLSAEQLVEAWLEFLRTPDARKDNAKFVPGMHVWFKGGRFEAFLRAPATANDPAKDDGPPLALMQCFHQYGTGGAWTGARHGWPTAPDLAEAAGMYPDELYERYGVPRPAAPETGRAA